MSFRRVSLSGMSFPGRGRVSNWQKYLELLEREGVPARFRQGYMRHVARFVRHFPGARISVLGSAAITGYLQNLMADPDVAPWQVRQQVDALRWLLVELAGNREAMEIDRGFWAENAGTLT